jgi:hypothetical protein
MICKKTLFLPLISAFTAATVMQSAAQVVLEMSSNKTYRDNKRGTQFRGGDFKVAASDGDAIYVRGCARPYYWRPNIKDDPCPGGSTAFLIFGNFDRESRNLGPYFWVTTVVPSIIIEPRRPDLVFLKAAPASELPRPSAGFTDTSFALYYNLHTTSVSEYVIARYSKTRTYSSKQRDKFEEEIVPGVYHYALPRLKQPNLVAPLTAVIYPMAEGLQIKNKQETGFQYTFDDERRWTKEGFVELSFFKPNIIKWKGLTPSNVFPAVDDLYFSLRVLQDPSSAKSETDLTDNAAGTPQSIFPGFSSGGDPRVLLQNPLVTSFALPPIFEGGTRGVIELELERAFATSGVAYDFSNRRFQIPVMVVNRYSEYVEAILKGSTSPILNDSDGDGYNNLNEWILDSRANDSTSFPVEPVPEDHELDYDYDRNRVLRYSYFGFTVAEKLRTVPDVRYTLQRSRDNGKTWKNFVSDGDWTVNRVKIPVGYYAENKPARVEWQVESNFVDADNGNPIAPPGTASDRYRVKITLAK